MWVAAQRRGSWSGRRGQRSGAGGCFSSAPVVNTTWRAPGASTGTCEPISGQRVEALAPSVAAMAASGQKYPRGQGGSSAVGPRAQSPAVVGGWCFPSPWPDLPGWVQQNCRFFFVLYKNVNVLFSTRTSILLFQKREHQYFRRKTLE